MKKHQQLVGISIHVVLLGLVGGEPAAQQTLEGCASADSTCRNGCLAVGAVSAFQILRGRNSDSSQMDVCNAKCESAKATCEAQARAQGAAPTQPGGTAGAPVPGPQDGSGAPQRTGLPFTECQRQENASDIGPKLRRIPASDTVQQTRGIIVASDFMISTYSQCLPDRRAQDVVTQYRRTRADSLRTCQQVSNNPAICERSPF